MTVDQELGDRAAHDAGEDQAKGGAGDADLHGIGDPILRGDQGRPGDGGAVAADQGDGPARDPDCCRQAEERRNPDTREVLGKHKGDGDGQAGSVAAAPGEQVAGAGIDADGGEEIDQQDVPRPQLEVHRDPGGEIEDPE